MTKILITIGVVVGLIVLVGGWYAKQQYDAVERGKAIEREKIVAKTNQNIAERRARDAKFNRDDTIKLCRDAGLEWFSDAGRSYCRVKPAG